MAQDEDAYSHRSAARMEISVDNNLISDCGAEDKGTFEFKSFGDPWLVIFNGRCGVLLDPGMANMWRRGGAKRFESLDGRSLAVIVPCAGRGFRSRVLSIV